MVFSSLPFLFFFLPIVLILYYIVPKKYRDFRNLILFFTSLVFYGWGEPIYILIMIFSTIVDYTHGLLVEKFKLNGNFKKAKAVLISSLIINLSLLCFFKYSDFLISNVNSLFNLNIKLLNITLPIGISFYTFQTLSYTIDVYKGQVKAQKNIIAFGTYVSLFPQLIAGPIVQYKTVANQLENRCENMDLFSKGIDRFLIGLFKKVLLANSIGLLWSQISEMNFNTLPLITAWIGIIAFAFQIYFDFSGYSDMAIGLGHMFGFSFLENFDYPYMSKSITEFWRRWHISLGTWFREYVYIPLGGNKKGLLNQIRNITIVWLLTGIWHGASWNFLIWGAYFGVILIIEKVFLLKYLKRCPKFIAHIYTMFLILISWVLFAFDDFNKIKLYLKALFGFNNSEIINSQSLYYIYTYLLLFIILILASTNCFKKLKEILLLKYKQKTVTIEFIKSITYIVILILSVSYLVNDSYNPFLYFRF